MTQQLNDVRRMFPEFQAATPAKTLISKFTSMFAHKGNYALEKKGDNWTFDKSKAWMHNPPTDADHMLMTQFETWIQQGVGLASKIELVQPVESQPMDVARAAAALPAPVDDPLASALEKVRQLEAAAVLEKVKHEQEKQAHAAELAAKSHKNDAEQAEQIKMVLKQATEEAVAKITAAAAAISLNAKSTAEEDKAASQLEKDKTTAALQEMQNTTARIQQETLTALASIKEAKIKVPVDSIITASVCLVPTVDEKKTEGAQNRKKRGRGDDENQEGGAMSKYAYNALRFASTLIVGKNATKEMEALVTGPVKKTFKKDD